MSTDPSPPRLEAPYLYLLLAIQVLQDGAVEEAEPDHLDRFQRLIGLSDAEAEDLRARARREYEEGMLVDHGRLDPEVAFESACIVAWADGWVERKEKVLLDLVGRLFKIPASRASEILERTRPKE